MELLSINQELALDRPRKAAPKQLRRLLNVGSEFVLHDRQSCRPEQQERYIADTYSQAYQASVTEFAPYLLELTCGGSISGVAGIRPAMSNNAANKLFLEHYLDVPLDELVAPRVGKPTERAAYVEVCNLAARRPGACQLINIVLVASLYAAGFRYAGFVSTAQLERIVRKQHFSVRNIAVADPSRLGNVAGQWGNYYECSPNVLLVDIRKTLQNIREYTLPRAVLAFYVSSIEAVGQRLAQASSARVLLP